MVGAKSPASPLTYPWQFDILQTPPAVRPGPFSDSKSSATWSRRHDGFDTVL